MDGVDGTVSSGIAILIVYAIFFPLMELVCAIKVIELFKLTGISNATPASPSLGFA